MAHVRQSSSDSGLGIRVEILEIVPPYPPRTDRTTVDTCAHGPFPLSTFKLIPLHLKSDCGERCEVLKGLADGEVL